MYSVAVCGVGIAAMLILDRVAHSGTAALLTGCLAFVVAVIVAQWEEGQKVQ